MASSVAQSSVLGSTLNVVERGQFLGSKTFSVSFRPRKTAAFQKLETKAVVSRDVDVEKVVPQGDRVLLRLEENAKTTAGGVLLPSSVTKYDKILVGEVISAGKEAGGVSKGDKVIVSDLNAFEVNIGSDDAKIVFCRESDLLAVVS